MILKNILSSTGDFSFDFSSKNFMFGVVAKILSLNGLPIKNELFRLKSSTRHGVFRCGRLVVKISPIVSEIPDAGLGYDSELYAYSRLQMGFMSAPKLIAQGEIWAKYLFKYIVLEYIPGVSLGDLKMEPDRDKKRDYAKQIFKIASLINRPEDVFNGVNILENAMNRDLFSHMSHSFREQRKAVLQKFRPNCFLFSHGNLTRDNIIVGFGDVLFVVGFSNACIAPIEYELANLVFDLLGMDKYYLRGFFGLYDSFELAERCLHGVLIHGNGENIIRNAFGDIESINSVNQLRDMIFRRVKIQ